MNKQKSVIKEFKFLVAIAMIIFAIVLIIIIYFSLDLMPNHFPTDHIPYTNQPSFQSRIPFSTPEASGLVGKSDIDIPTQIQNEKTYTDSNAGVDFDSCSILLSILDYLQTPVPEGLVTLNKQTFPFRNGSIKIDMTSERQDDCSIVITASGYGKREISIGQDEIFNHNEIKKTIFLDYLSSLEFHVFTDFYDKKPTSNAIVYLWKGQSFPRPVHTFCAFPISDANGSNVNLTLRYINNEFVVDTINSEWINQEKEFPNPGDHVVGIDCFSKGFFSHYFFNDQLPFLPMKPQ